MKIPVMINLTFVVCAFTGRAQAPYQSDWVLAQWEMGLQRSNDQILTTTAFESAMEVSIGNIFTGSDSLSTDVNKLDSFSGTMSPQSWGLVATEDDELDSIALSLNSAQDVFLALTSEPFDGAGAGLGDDTDILFGVRFPSNLTQAQAAGTWRLHELSLGIFNIKEVGNIEAVQATIDIRANGTVGATFTLGENAGESIETTWSLQDNRVAVQTGDASPFTPAINAGLDLMIAPDISPNNSAGLGILIRQPEPGSVIDPVGFWDVVRFEVFSFSSDFGFGGSTERFAVQVMADGSFAITTIDGTVNDTGSATGTWRVENGDIVFQIDGESVVLDVAANGTVAANLIVDGRENELWVAVKTASPIELPDAFDPVAIAFPSADPPTPEKWYRSPWFGWFNGAEWPYIRHAEHGLLFPVALGDENFWFLDGELGWFYSQSGLYPNIFVANHGWLRHVPGSTVESGRRWFWDYQQTDWRAFPPLQ